MKRNYVDMSSVYTARICIAEYPKVSLATFVGEELYSPLDMVPKLHLMGFLETNPFRSKTWNAYTLFMCLWIYNLEDNHRLLSSNMQNSQNTLRVYICCIICIILSIAYVCMLRYRPCDRVIILIYRGSNAPPFSIF